MTIRPIREVFEQQGLRLPTLSVLTADAHTYTVLAIQPSGEVTVRDDFVGHENRDLAQVKFSEFLQLATQTDADLVLAPEYSCPWNVLVSAIQRNQFPGTGKLWILGCEALTRHELTQITQTNPNVAWLHESLLSKPGQFFNVVCYLLKTESTAGETKMVALLQFKTQAMADINAFERDHMIEGETMYLFHNQDDVIRLMTLVCSEALVFQPQGHAECGFHGHPFLVFHPQLNYDPLNLNIKAYRSELFREVADWTEVFALNWGRKFRIAPRPACQYGGSAVYLKSSRFLRSDERLDTNHKKGLYYTNWYPLRSHVCFLNFDEHVFHFRMQKSHAVGPGAGVLQNRTGPEMRALWKWSTQEQRWRDCAIADDDFQSLCDGYQEGSFACCLGDAISSIDRERLLALSAGKLEPAIDWHKIDRLFSYMVGEDEVCRRLVFAQEQNLLSVEFRKSHLRLYIKLHKDIIPNQANFPETIADLKGNARLRAPTQNDGFRFNLVSTDGASQGATAVFVGHESPEYVKQLMHKFVENWKPELTRRLVIWHEHGGQIKSQHPPLPTVTDDSEGPTSIARADST